MTAKKFLPRTSGMPHGFFRAAWDHFARRSLFLPLLIVECAVIVTVDPRGDFPLNDDWIYSQMVQSLVRDHSLVPHVFAQPTAVVQIVWGALFCSVFGVSYTVLRVSTLVLALVGGWAAACCARACGLSRRAALACGILLLGNPLYCCLSFTFMTDVPFCVLVSVSALFYLRALRVMRARDVALGSLFGALAFLVRQFGIIPGLAFLVVYCVRIWRDGPKLSLRAIAGFAVPWVSAGILFGLWQHLRDSSVSFDAVFANNPWWGRMLFCAVYVFMILTLLSLFLAPFAAARLCSMFRRGSRWRWYRFIIAGFIAALAAVCFVHVLKAPMPQPGNTITKQYLGAITIADDPNAGETPELVRFWWGVTAVAIAMLALLLTEVLCLLAGEAKRLISRSGDPGANGFSAGQPLFLFLWAALTLASSYTPLTFYPFDRYIMPMVVPASILAAASLPVALRRIEWTTLGVLCAAIGVLSVAGTKDYLNWNRARWEALGFLQQDMHILPEHINGGYEFNGLYTSTRFMKERNVHNFWQSSTHGWWVLDNAYIVSMSPLPGLNVVKTFPYCSWLNREMRNVYVLERGPDRR